MGGPMHGLLRSNPVASMPPQPDTSMQTRNRSTLHSGSTKDCHSYPNPPRSPLPPPHPFPHPFAYTLLRGRELALYCSTFLSLPRRACSLTIAPPTEQGGAPLPDPLEHETIFLILHHLHQHATVPSIRDALVSLETALLHNKLLPSRVDYTGNDHLLTYQQAARHFSHIPQDYLRDFLRTRLPEGTQTLFGKARYATCPKKRPRPPRLDRIKARLRPTSSNVFTLVDQQRFLNVPMPFHKATFALLPKSFRKLKRVIGHHLPVFSAVFDNSSRLVLTGGDDNLVKVWCTETAYLQQTLRGHDSDITEIVKHPTLPIVVSASSDTTLRVWNVDTGAALHVLDGGQKEVNAVQFSPCPDRPYLVSGGADGSVRLWNADNFSAGCIRIPIPERGLTSNYRHVSDTWRAASTSAAVATSRIAPTSPVADGISGGPHHELHQGHILLGNSPAVPSSAASAHMLPPAALSMPGASGFSVLPASALAIPTSSGAASAFGASSSQPQLGVSAGRGQFAASSNPLPTTPSPSPRQANERPLTRDPTAHSLAANSVVSGGQSTYSVLSVGFNAGATRLAVAGTDSCVYLYAIEKAEEADSLFPSIRYLTTLRGHSEQIIQVLFSRAGDSIVTACRDGTARIWNRVKARLPVGKKRKQSVAGMGKWSSMVLDCRSSIQADARSVLSGGASGSACGSIVPRMRRATFPVSVDATMWSLNDKRVFTASSDAKIRIWEAQTGRLLRVLEAHEREVYVMDCHPTDERILLSGGYDGRCILWDIETGKQLRMFTVWDGPDDPFEQTVPFGSHKRPSITDGQFSADGLSFAVSDTSGALTVFACNSVEATALAPEEQFFSKDYAPYRRDRENRAVDEDTGLLLHLVNKGRLCNKDLRPHPPELQPNMLLSGPMAKRFDADGDDVHSEQKTPHSRSSVENRNRDALMLRAKEFRANQEKEERRLLREARQARRRMILEKEKAALERDTIPSFQLRDFEVQDSDVDDSDEDFDGDIEQEASGSSSSSSSSEEEDKIRPDRPTRTSRRQTHSFSDIDDDRGRSRLGQQMASDRRQLRMRVGPCRIEKRRRMARNHRLRDRVSAEIGESEGDIGDDSPGYELESQDSDSENSGTSKERMRGSGVDGNSSTGTLLNRHAAEIRAGAEIRPSVSPRLSPRAPATVPSTAHPVLAGASRSDGSRRMRISIGGNFSAGSPPARFASVTGDRELLPRAPTEVGHGASDVALVQENVANSVASYDGRGQASEVGDVIRGPTPRNASFTSERVERKDNSNVIERSSKAVEDNQGDTASFVRPRRRGPGVEDGSSAWRRQRSLEQRNSSVNKVRRDSVNGSHFANTVNDSSDAQRTDGHEKSLLSDSPARAQRQRARRRGRTRKLDNTLPVYDIDEVADREVALLDAKGEQKTSRKRQRRSFDDMGDGDYFSDEGVGRRASMGSDHDDISHRARKVRKRDTTVSERPSTSSAEKGRSARSRTRTLSASSWLRSSSNRYTYVPQLGDDVMYFPEGHASAMAISRATGVEPVAGLAAVKKAGKEILDGSSFPADASPVRFQIVDVSYEFPVLSTSQKPRSASSRPKASRGSHVHNRETAKTTLVLTLRLVSGLPSRTGATDRFVLCYYPVDAPEYLVLTNRVEAALNRAWTASDRFRILFLNESRAWQYYTGTIRSVRPTIRSVMWNSVEVVYDNEGEKEKTACELVSPWELESFHIHQRGRAATSHSFAPLRSSTIEPGLCPLIARDFETIRETETNWRVQLSWLDNVDALAALPGYCGKIPCPMDFNTILVRLCTGYYRHFCSFLHDIDLMKRNVVRFHGAGSENTRLALSLYTRLSDTAERARVAFLSSLIPVMPSPSFSHNAPPSHSGSRTIRPRPTQNEAMAHAQAYPVGVARVGRLFPGSQPTAQAGASLTVPPSYSNEGSGVLSSLAPFSNQQRQWPTTRSYLNSGQGHGVYPGQSLGVALPPILPGVTHPPAPTRGPRASRLTGRGQTNFRQSSAGPARKGYAQASGGHCASQSQSGVGSLSQSAADPGHHHISDMNQNHRQVAMVANSNPASDGNRASSRRIAPSSILLDPRGTVKQAVSSIGASQVPANRRIAETGNLSNRGRGGTGVLSPVQDAVPGPSGGTLSMVQSSPHGQLTRQHSIGVSSFPAGDGTHSWGRSMEGAGGTFPLHASTSDSHIPQTQTGRSPSPASPSMSPRDRGNPDVRQQTVSVRQQALAGGSATAPFHEHSTVSVAAAESTMSCGGAEVAMQAATAESADAVVTERTRGTSNR